MKSKEKETIIDYLQKFDYRECPVPRILIPAIIRYFVKRVVLPGGEWYNIVCYISAPFNDNEIVANFGAQFNIEEHDSTFNIDTVGWYNSKENGVNLEKFMQRVEEFFLAAHEFSKNVRKIKDRI